MSTEHHPRSRPAAPGPAECPAPVLSVVTTSAESTRGLGARLAPLLRAGDLVLLSGDLGAGKTTLAQGVGSALGVRGRVSSPTFVIARAHPCPGRGPGLIHVDAYRLESLEEVDALDLEASMEDCVTLVEWGRGKVEALAADRLEIEVRRPRGGLGTAASRTTDLAAADDGRREIIVRGLGQRWAGAALEGLGEDDG